MPPTRRANIGRRLRNTVAVHNYRDNQSDEERSQRLESQRLRSAQARSTMTPNQRRVARSSRTVVDNLLNNMQRRQNRRPNISIQYERLAFRYDAGIDYAADASVDFGTLSVICQYYNALRFPQESPGLCCVNGKIRLPQL
jgi:hypothetical protein